MSITIRCKKCQFDKDNPTFEYCYEHCWKRRSENMLKDYYDEPIKIKEPPIGIMPRAIWEDKRKRDIVNAMKRYADEGVPIPLEWIDELNDIEWRNSN